jgi:hypothetical protein
MERIARGDRIFLNVDEWVNKTSGRMDVSLGAYIDHTVRRGSYSYKETEFEPFQEFMTIGFASWREMATRQFQWAKFVPDEYSEPVEDTVHDAYLSEHGAWDSEDGVYIDVMGEFEDYWDEALKAWRDGFIGEDGGGEVSRYRMELKLNALGRAFIRVHRHLDGGPAPVEEL